MITKRKLRTVIGKLMDEIGDKIKAARTIEDSGAADKNSDLMSLWAMVGLLINLSLRLDLYTKKQREELLQAILELGLEDKPKEES